MKLKVFVDRNTKLLARDCGESAKNGDNGSG